jgi:hypothetical protein
MNKKIICSIVIFIVFVFQAKTQIYFGIGAIGSLPLGNTKKNINAGLGPFGEIGYTIKKLEISAKANKVYYSSVMQGYSLNLYDVQLSYILFSSSLDIYAGIGIGYAQEKIKIDNTNQTLSNGSIYVYPEIGFYKSFGKERHFKLKVFSQYIHAKPVNVFQSINIGIGAIYQL